MRRIEGAAREVGYKQFSPEFVNKVQARAEQARRAGAQPRGAGGQFVEAGIGGMEGRFAGIEQELEPTTDWIPVSSSNVEAIRWVGGQYGLQVRFLAKKRWPSSTYEYNLGYSTFRAMLEASSKGKFVWAMRHANIPYRRIAGGIGGTRTIVYPFGGTRKGAKVRYPTGPKAFAVGPYYKNWATPGYHPPGTEQPRR